MRTQQATEREEGSRSRRRQERTEEWGERRRGIIKRLKQEKRGPRATAWLTSERFPSAAEQNEASPRERARFFRNVLQGKVPVAGRRLSTPAPPPG